NISGSITDSAPNNHLAACPDSSVVKASRGRAVGRDGCPGIVQWIVPATVVQEDTVGKPTPNDHFVSGPHRGEASACTGSANRCDRRPTVGYGVVATSSIERTVAVSSPPHDHFTACPYGCVATTRGGRRIRRA